MNMQKDLLDQFQNLSPEAQQAMMLQMGSTFAAALQGNQGVSGNLEVLGYMTRQPALIRGMRVRGTHTCETVAVVHPDNKKDVIYINKEDFNPEFHTLAHKSKQPSNHGIPGVSTSRFSSEDEDEGEEAADDESEAEESEDEDEDTGLQKRTSSKGKKAKK